MTFSPDFPVSSGAVSVATPAVAIRLLFASLSFSGVLAVAAGVEEELAAAVAVPRVVASAPLSVAQAVAVAAVLVGVTLPVVLVSFSALLLVFFALLPVS